MKKWLAVCGIYLSLILADGFLTHLNTPELTLEANPLVLYGGLGWKMLILINFVIFVSYCLISSYPLILYKSLTTNTTNIGEYISYLLFKRTDKLIWSLYKTPDNFRPVFAMTAYAVSYSLIAARLAVVSEWILITLHVKLHSYGAIRNRLPLGRPDTLVFLTFYIFLVVFWILKEYKHSCKCKAS